MESSQKSPKEIVASKWEGIVFKLLRRCENLGIHQKPRKSLLDARDISLSMAEDAGMSHSNQLTSLTHSTPLSSLESTIAGKESEVALVGTGDLEQHQNEVEEVGHRTPLQAGQGTSMPAPPPASRAAYDQVGQTDDGEHETCVTSTVAHDGHGNEASHEQGTSMPAPAPASGTAYNQVEQVTDDGEHETRVTRTVAHDGHGNEASHGQGSGESDTTDESHSCLYNFTKDFIKDPRYVVFRLGLQARRWFDSLKTCGICSDKEQNKAMYALGFFSSDRDGVPVCFENYVTAHGSPKDVEEDIYELQKVFDEQGNFAWSYFPPRSTRFAAMDPDYLPGLDNYRKSRKSSKKERHEIDIVKENVLPSIRRMVPNGQSGVMGGEKFLRARKVKEWRKKLQQNATDELMLCGLGGDDEERRKHKLARVKGKLPYYIWAERTVVECAGCRKSDISGEDYYYHCSYAACGIHSKNCENCKVDLRQNENILALDEERRKLPAFGMGVHPQQVMKVEATNPTTVCNCSKICQTSICMSCYRETWDSIEDGQKDDPVERSRAVESHINDRNYDGNYRVKRMRASDQAQKQKRPLLGDDNGTNTDEEQPLLTDHVYKLENFEKDIAVQDLDMYKEEKKNRYQRLYTLHRAIAEDPDIFFPYLDAYSVNGIPSSHTAGGWSTTMIMIMVLLTQIVVPVTLMANLSSQWSWEVVTIFNKSDTDDDIYATCDAWALEKVEESLFPLGKYRTRVFDGNDTFTCFTDMTSVCDRTEDPKRRLVGFFLVGTLCLASIANFYSMFRGYTYQGEALLFKLRRRREADLCSSGKGQEMIRTKSRTAQRENASFASLVRACIGAVIFRVMMMCNKSDDHDTKEKARDYVTSVTANNLFPLFASDDVPDDYIDELIDVVIKYKLPVPYKLCFILQECIPKITLDPKILSRGELRPNHHLSPRAIVLSICINFAVLFTTLTTSLYICVQSDSLTDLVLNTVALEFLLTLDDNCIDRNKSLLQIKQIALKAAKQLVYEGVCTSADPNILNELEMDDEASLEVKNRNTTRESLSMLQSNEENIKLGNMERMTPGLSMIANFNRAIHSPVNMNAYIVYPVEWIRTAYELCYYVYFERLVVGEIKKAARLSAVSVPKELARTDSTSSIGENGGMIDTTLAQKLANKLMGISQLFKTSMLSLGTFFLFSLYLLSLVYRGLSFLFFLPLYFPPLIFVGGVYITIYATICI